MTVKIRVKAGRGPFKEIKESQLNIELTDIFEKALESRIRARLTFDAKTVQARLLSQLTKAYVEGVRENVASWVGQMSGLSGDRRMLPMRNPDLAMGQQALRKNIRGYTSSMLGTTQPASTPVLWPSLAISTMKKKAGSVRRGDRNAANARKFFIHTGELKSKLTRGVRQMVARTGVVSVSAPRRHLGRFVKLNNPRGKSYLYDLRITFLPQVRGQLPGLRSGQWSMDSGTVDFERMLGFDSHTLDKLNNSFGDDRPLHMSKRPLLQPIFTYYTMFRAPAIIAKELPELIRFVGKGVSS